jgi:hypothetical protein
MVGTNITAGYVLILLMAGVLAWLVGLIFTMVGTNVFAGYVSSFLS